MDRGSKHRPSRTPGRGRRLPDRRVPPPDATGREAEFFGQQVASGRPLVIHLVSGETVRGAIEQFDRELITVARRTGPDVVLRKREIRYIEEEA